MREIALFLHLTGVLVFVGGCVSAALTAAPLLGAAKEAREAGLAAVRRSLLVVATPGLALAWIGGLTIFVTFIDIYKRAGWMHGKITIALVLSALHGVLMAKVRRATADSSAASAGFFQGVAVAIAVGAALIAALVVFRP